MAQFIFFFYYFMDILLWSDDVCAQLMKVISNILLIDKWKYVNIVIEAETK